MKLNSYLKRDRGRASQLAVTLGLSPVLVSQWASGDRQVPVTRCAAIERATGGQVTRKDLRPQDWHLIWPELLDERLARPDSFGHPPQQEEVANHA